MKNSSSLSYFLLSIAFSLISLKASAQAQKHRFKDGTEVSLAIVDDHPLRGFKHYTYLGFLFEYRNDFRTQFLLNSGYHFTDRLLAQARINIIPGNFSNSQYSLGAYYNLSSSIQSKKTRVPVKVTETFRLTTQYYVEKPLLRSRTWQVYGGYSYIGHDLVQPTVDNTVYTGPEQYNFFVPNVGFMGTHMIDIGLALQKQRDYIYDVDKERINYLSRVRTSLKIHVPIARNYSVNYSYALEAGGQILQKESSDVNLPDTYLRQIGFSLETEWLAGGESLNSKLITNSNFSIGYFPLVNDSGALIIRFTTGYGYGKKGKTATKKQLRTFR